MSTAVQTNRLMILVLGVVLCAAVAAAPPDRGATPIRAVDLKVQGAVVTLVTAFPLTVTAPEGGYLYRWNGTAGLKFVERRNVCTVTGGTKGTHTLTVSYVTFDKTKDPPFNELTGETSFAVGEASPVPPVPPGPDPTPPGPAPDPAAPFAGVTPTGMRVLIVEESEKRTELPVGQRSIIQGATVRTYLRDKTAKAAGTGKPEFWILDKDDDVTALPKHWQDAMKAKRDGVPWLYIGDGKSGESVPLPKTVDEMMKVMKKYGG